MLNPNFRFDHNEEIGDDNPDHLRHLGSKKKENETWGCVRSLLIWFSPIWVPALLLSMGSDDSSLPKPTVQNSTSRDRGGTTWVSKSQMYVSTETPHPTPRPTMTNEEIDFLIWQEESEQEKSRNCHPSYPTLCIDPHLGYDLDCRDIDAKSFPVIGDDPHNFDGDGDGIGCEPKPAW